MIKEVLGLPAERWIPLVLKKIKKDTEAMNEIDFQTYWISKIIAGNHIHTDITEFLRLEKRKNLTFEQMRTKIYKYVEDRETEEIQQLINSYKQTVAKNTTVEMI